MNTFYWILAVSATIWLYGKIKKQRKINQEKDLFEIDSKDASIRHCKVCDQEQRKFLEQASGYYEYFVWHSIEPYNFLLKDGPCKCVQHTGKPIKVLGKV